MLWLSDDDGDPPWWMWIVMLILATCSVLLLYKSMSPTWGYTPFRRYSVVPLLACLYWFTARLWFWFDKS